MNFFPKFKCEKRLYYDIKTTNRYKLDNHLNLEALNSRFLIVLNSSIVCRHPSAVGTQNSTTTERGSNSAET